MATTVDPNALSNDELIAIAVTASVGGVALLGLVIGITVWWCCVRPKDEKKRTVKHLYHHRDINGQIVEAPPPNAYNNGSMDNLDDRRYGNGYANGMYLDDRGREMRTGHNSMPSVSGHSYENAPTRHRYFPPPRDEYPSAPPVQLTEPIVVERNDPIRNERAYRSGPSVHASEHSVHEREVYRSDPPIYAHVHKEVVRNQGPRLPRSYAPDGGGPPLPLHSLFNYPSKKQPVIVSQTPPNEELPIKKEVEYLYYDGGHPPNGDVPRGAPKMESTSEHLFNNRWYIPRPQVSYR